MRILPTDRAIKMYVGSWSEWMESVGVSWDDEYDVLYEDEIFELENCQLCPDEDVCTLMPEEREDECHFIRSEEEPYQ